MINQLKQKLARGETCVGMFLTIPSTEIVEIAGITGYDFVVLDMEHGHITQDFALQAIIAADRRAIPALIRVPQINAPQIINLLDSGAYGIQLPQTGRKQDAEDLVQCSNYYPRGCRGMGAPRLGDYGAINLKQYMQEANEFCLNVVQCESREGYEHLEEIAQTESIDVIFFGPYDMSQSLGIPGDVNAEIMNGMRRRILEVCRKYGKVPGTYAQDGAAARRMSEMGFRYITMGMDVDHILDKFQKEQAQINA